MKKIEVHSGMTIQDKCRGEKHPVQEVLNAQEIIDAVVTSSPSFSDNMVVYSNSPDFISAMKYIGKKHGAEVEFFLDGVSHGNDIEPLFKDFNKALDMIKELGDTEE